MKDTKLQRLVLRRLYDRYKGKCETVEPEDFPLKAAMKTERLWYIATQLQELGYVEGTPFDSKTGVNSVYLTLKGIAKVESTWFSRNKDAFIMNLIFLLGGMVLGVVGTLLVQRLATLPN